MTLSKREQLLRFLANHNISAWTAVLMLVEEIDKVAMDKDPKENMMLKQDYEKRSQ